MRGYCRIGLIFLVQICSLSGCGILSRPTENSPESTAENDLIVVGFAQIGAESDWRVANTESIMSTFTEENGFELVFNDGQQKFENQVKALRNFIQLEVDYIVLAPVVETGWDTVFAEVKAANIPLIISDRFVEVKDDSLYTAWVGSDFLSEGEKAIDWLNSYLESQGRADEEINIVELQGTLGSTAEIGRTEGIARKLAEKPNYHLIAIESADFIQSKAREVMGVLLQKHNEIGVVIAQNDNMAFGAIEAMKAAGKIPGKEIIVISFDAVRAAFNAMLAGDLNVSVECNPLHGPRVAEIIRKLEAGEPVEKKRYVDEAVFDQENAAEQLPARTY